MIPIFSSLSANWPMRTTIFIFWALIILRRDWQRATQRLMLRCGLRPDGGEGHLAQAEHLYRGYGDYDGALAELEDRAPSICRMMLEFWN